MKFLKPFTLFEREMSKAWMDNNKDFYLMKNKEQLDVKSNINSVIDTLSIDSIKFNENGDKFDCILPKELIEKISKFIPLPANFTVSISLYKRDETLPPNIIITDNSEKLYVSALYDNLTNKIILAFMKAYPGSYITINGIEPFIKAGIKVYKVENKYETVNVISNVVNVENDSINILENIKSILSNVNTNDLTVKLTDDNKFQENWKVSLEDEKLLDLVISYRKSASRRSFSAHIDFQIEKPLNRSHTNGLAKELHGIGLGYKMYKALINKLGYVRSSYYSTNENSRKIWYHLIQDVDFYSIILNKGIKDKDSPNHPSLEVEGVMIISKSYPVDKIKELIKTCKETFKTIELDDELKNIVAE